MEHLYREGGFEQKFSKNSNAPGVARGGGVLKLRFDLYDLTDYHYGLGSVRLCSKR